MSHALRKEFIVDYFFGRLSAILKVLICLKKIRKKLHRKENQVKIFVVSQLKLAR